MIGWSRQAMLLLCVSLCVLAEQQPKQEDGKIVIPEIAMEDQFEQKVDVKNYLGDVVVLIYGDQKSAASNRVLGEKIHTHFHPQAAGQTPAKARKAPVTPVPGVADGERSPEVVSIPVACIGKVPSLVAKLIRSQIRKGSPDVPVWLDFADRMKSEFPFKPGVPNVIVLDTHGRYRYAAAGQPTAAGTVKLLGKIEALRQEAVEGK
jgi:hypothetical protein